MASYKFYQPLQFRPVAISDLAFVARWLTATTGQSAVWERRFFKMLDWEWEEFASLSGRDSWMAMSGGRRLFFVEVGSANELYVAGSAEFMRGFRLMPVYLQDLAVHLYDLGFRGLVKITLHGVDDVYYLLLSASGSFLEFVVPLRREK